MTLLELTLVFTGFAGIVYFVLKNADGEVSGSLNERPTIRQTGSYFREVVGESFYQPNLRRIMGSRRDLRCTARVILDDKNAHDSMAVAVFIAGLLVGHLSRDEARAYRNRLERQQMTDLECIVGAHIAGGGKGKMFGVWLDLPERMA